MAELLHQVWDDPESNARMCWIAGNESDRMRRALHPKAKLVRTFLASSHDDAMRQHYAAESWGEYEGVPGVSDQPYSDEQAREQREYLARES